MEAAFRKGFEARKGHFDIDARVREVMKETWPTIALVIDAAPEAVLTAAAKLPHIAEIIASNWLMNPCIASGVRLSNRSECPGRA